MKKNDKQNQRKRSTADQEHLIAAAKALKKVMAIPFNPTHGRGGPITVYSSSVKPIRSLKAASK